MEESISAEESSETEAHAEYVLKTTCLDAVSNQ